MSKIKMALTALSLLSGFAFLAAPRRAVADVVHDDNVIIKGNACIADTTSGNCDDGHSFTADLEIISAFPELLFFDVTNGESDWELIVASGDFVFKEIPDVGTPQNVLRIAAGSGNLGLGTATPSQELHIAAISPSIMFDDTDGGTSWTVHANSGGFRILDDAATRLWIDPDSNIGMGTSTPSAPLHITRSNGTTKLLVQETSFLEGSRTLLQVTNKGEAKFGFNNTAFPQQWEFFASVGFSVNEITNPGLEFVFTPTGNLNMTGTLTTGGPSCSGGCDELFQPGGELESIEDHAAAMWENSHLPGVGPTAAGEPVNLTEKVGGLINELEKAHIYIERLHEQLKQERRRNDDLEARLARLEGSLGVRAGD